MKRTSYSYTFMPNSKKSFNIFSTFQPALTRHLQGPHPWPLSWEERGNKVEYLSPHLPSLQACREGWRVKRDGVGKWSEDIFQFNGKNRALIILLVKINILIIVECCKTIEVEMRCYRYVGKYHCRKNISV